MHQNTFGGRASPGPTGMVKCFPDSLAAMRGCFTPTVEGDGERDGKRRRGKGGAKEWGRDEGGEKTGNGKRKRRGERKKGA